MNGRRPTRRQAVTLMVLDNNGLCSVADVAMHAHASEDAERSRLLGMESRGWVTRQYTGSHSGSNFVYAITGDGQEALEVSDVPEDPDECDLCGSGGGRHYRMCVLSPDRPRRVRTA